jgi:hypothetical protein
LQAGRASLQRLARVDALDPQDLVAGELGLESFFECFFFE